jgi:hypothetical protein
MAWDTSVKVVSGNVGDVRAAGSGGAALRLLLLLPLLRLFLALLVQVIARTGAGHLRLTTC